MTLREFLNLDFKFKTRGIFLLNNHNITLYDLKHVPEINDEIIRIEVSVGTTKLKDIDIGIDFLGEEKEYEYLLDIPYQSFYYDVTFNIITKERN